MAILQGARITGSIIATSFIKAAGFSGSLTASNLYVLGKAGIGTSSPLYKTDIAGSTGYDITTDNATVLRVRSITSRYPTFPGETTAIALTKTNEPYGWRLLSQYVADTYAGANFHIQNSINVTPAWESKLTILRDGNVGIGTTSPSSAASFNKVVEAYDATSLSYQVNSGGTYKAEFGISSNGGWLGTSTTHDMRFVSNGTERMRITSGGNIGIGTTSPIQKLHIVGSTLITNNNYHYGYTVAGAQSNLIGISSADNIMVGQNNVNHANTIIYGGLGVIDLNTSGSTRMRVTYDGNVGIGTTSPGAKLELYNGNFKISDGNRIIFGASDPQIYGNSGVLTFRTNSTDKMYLDANGNLGIGTSSPLERITFGSSDSIIARSSDTTFNSGYCSRILFNQGGTGYGYLGFYTYEGGSGGGERMRIAENGNVGIGTTSPGAKLDIRQTSAATGLRVFTNDTTTANIAQFVGYDNSLGDTTRMVIQAGGNVGIGTTSPGNLLHVYSTASETAIKVTSTASSGDAALYLQAFNATPGNNVISFGDTASSGVGQIVYQHSNDSMQFKTNSSERVRIDSSGNVGIGTSTVGNKLTVYTTTQYDGYYLRNSNGVVGTMLGVSATNDDGTIGLYSNVVLKTNITANGASYFNGGSVGIGTTSPKQSLTIFGEISLRNNDAYYWNAYYSSGFKYIGTGYAGYTIIDSTGAYTINTTNSSGTADAVASMVTRMYISSSGNVGIGTTSPLTKLNLSGGSGAVYQTFTDTTNAYHHGYVGKNGGGLVFGFSSQNGSFSADEKMRIDTTGNVGIGTSSPSYKLDVAGGIKIGGEETLPFAIGSMYLSYNSAINRIYYGDGTGYDLRFSKRGAGATTDFVTFKDTGNVGIGTSSPVNKLHVSGSSTNLPLKLEGLTSNATGYFLTVDNTTGVVYKSTGGANGTSGTSGANGSPGTSGTSGSGSSGISGSSGTSGTTNIKAWVHFDGTGTPTINASLNVSSITDNNTGDYTINFTTAFANANYVVAGTVTYEYENPGQSINNMFIAVPRRPTAQLAGSCRISTPGSDNALYDCKYVRVLFSN